MQIITVTSTKEIPRTFAYREYPGKTAQDAAADFHARYPHYEPGMAWWFPRREILYIPFDCVRIVNG